MFVDGVSRYEIKYLIDILLLILFLIFVKTNTVDSVTGTIISDVNDNIVKYKNGTSTWFNLSKNEANMVEGTTNYDTTGVVNTTLQTGLTDAPTAKTSIETVTSSPGTLVLEDNNKAMVLPKVASSHLAIINQEPGTMAYDMLNKQLAIYNGKVWSFWKP